MDIEVDEVEYVHFLSSLERGWAGADDVVVAGIPAHYCLIHIAFGRFNFCKINQNSPSKQLASPFLIARP